MRAALPFALVIVAACLPPDAPPQAPVAPGQGKLVTFPCESEFTRADAQITDHLRRARLWNFAEPTQSKVSIEVVQLAIECTDPTLDCYAAVGKSVHADAILFATIDRASEDGALVVTVSVFDVRANAWVRRSAKKFPTEDDALYELKDIVADATKRGP
ncbi:MAG TPA: hypothetical protein VMZ53_04775 [Kofleriaceae bacterium]|nr:hypothetical protein [Kofleriaceae bacterium]